MRGVLRRAAALLFVCCSALLVGAIAAPSSDAATSGCGYARYARPGGGVYTCSFADDFGGSVLSAARWLPQTTAASGYHSGAECFMNRPQNVSVSRGMLNLTVRRESAPFLCASPAGNYMTQYTAGMVTTWGTFAQAYGRFEIRAKFPATTVAGLQSALWMAPPAPKYGPWPLSGEIDIAESYSQYPTYVIPYVHYIASGGYDLNSTNTTCRISNPAAFHTYLLEWTSSLIRISFDGKVCVSDSWNPAPPLTAPQPFDQPFMIALTQALGVGTNAVTAATPLPATTQIDYVRVWK
jgi:beta-glucanase (GH16 family)